MKTGVFALTTCSRTDANDSLKNGSFWYVAVMLTLPTDANVMVHLALLLESDRLVQLETLLLPLVNETVPERAPEPSVSDTVAVKVIGDPTGTAPLGDACRLTAEFPDAIVTNCWSLVADPSESVAVTE